MQFALFGLLAAILALKRPYLTLDLWVQRSPHEVGLSPAMWAGDRLNAGLLNRGGRASWRIAQAAAGVVGVTFNDLRGTAVTRLALVGCTEAEIAAISGHSLRDVRSILDAHYLHRDPALADAAITKLERNKNSRLSSRLLYEYLLRNEKCRAQSTD